MGNAAEQSRASKPTTLQRTLTTALNELGVEAALVGIFDREDGPLVVQGSRGFSPREVSAILRTLSGRDIAVLNEPAPTEEGESHGAVRLRLITPTAKSLLAVPLRHRQKMYGVLVIGRKESATFSKKEKSLIESASEEITSALEKAALFDGTLILSHPLVAQEPAPSTPPAGAEPFAPALSYATPDMQERIAAWLNEAAQALPFDRAWVTFYDPIAGVVEVLGLAGEQKGDQRKDLKPGQRLALDASAAGWAVRHRKPRVDNDLASTQGRFLDHKHLYKDRFKSAMVVPFFVRGQVGGTITLSSKTPMQYGLPDARALEPLMTKLVELLQEPSVTQVARTQTSPAGEPPAAPVPQAPAEPLIRKQERQAAIGEFSAFLATEIREPLASIRAQLEEVTGEGIMDFDPQTRVENAMRDLIRVEAILNEILDFAKPLELNRRLCRVPDIIEHALTLIATDLETNRIRVTKDYAANLSQVRCDEAKMQQVFLSIFKNSLEAMSPGGHLHIEVTQQRSGRTHDVQILIRNDGVPIPTEHVGKVFEPYFTTKRAGTGLGLATVKKIVEEHQGQISIASGPGQGTTVIIRIPPPVPRGSYRRRGRERRPHRR
ncbi:MAG: GAF domain-containing protein [Nitrospirae bacterium]|nr:GAF domain-containing protein [Nitrospirota bacterium]